MWILIQNAFINKNTHIWMHFASMMCLCHYVSWLTVTFKLNVKLITYEWLTWAFNLTLKFPNCCKHNAVKLPLCDISPIKTGRNYTIKKLTNVNSDYTVLKRFFQFEWVPCSRFILGSYMIAFAVLLQVFRIIKCNVSTSYSCMHIMLCRHFYCVQNSQLLD